LKGTKVSDLKGLVTLTANAEVRDKDGNLVSSTPVELTGTITADQARELTERQDQS
jgi:hypothetical protein